MTLRRNFFRRGFTLTELLVVLAIISLLATIAVPVYISRVQQARIAIARAETREIATAMQQVGIVHGFFVPIHILDNIPNTPAGSSGSFGTPGSLDDFDNLTNPSSHRVIDLARPLAGTASSQFGNQSTLSPTGSDPRVLRMINAWQGPFLNPHRVWFIGADPTTGQNGDLTLDLVLDPWGLPYRMYSPVGVTGSLNPPSAGGVSTSQYVLTADDGELTTDERDRFDRFAIVSYGPDGVTGFDSGAPQQNQGDDIVYTFVGVPPTESVYQGF
jgi:prepilin-type N-terminal cleavage/methylation domain-containing protein